MPALAAAWLETAEAWEQDGWAGGETREIMGAVEATFLERRLLVLMDLATGYLLLEEAADDQTNFLLTEEDMRSRMPGSSTRSAAKVTLCL